MRVGRGVSAPAVILVAALAASSALPVLANDALAYREIPGASAQPLPVRPLNREDAHAFVDGYMSARLSPGSIAGATVAIVKDGALLFAKGYGYEDVAKRTLVDAEQTLFRPGSVSKLVTAAAVMQLVEQGKLDLDADVNTYLTEFKIPSTHPQPVTLRNLLTHSAGFEDGGIGYMMPASGEDLVPLGTWLRQHVPARARAPTRDFTSGTTTSYSNWGVALAGHIVETIAGMSYDDYVERHIFVPLGMAHSTFREPLPPALAARLSGAYRMENGALERQGFEFIHHATPAGSLSATATDMAKFMLAFLPASAPGDTRILTPATIEAMFSRVLSPAAVVNGGGLGFYETRINGHRIVGHGGDTRYFHSVLSLLPEANVGVFASTNTGGPGLGAAAEEFAKAFIQHFFPANLPNLEPPVDAQARNARYAGTYRSLRRGYTTFDKVFAAFETFEVEPMPDGTLLLPDPLWDHRARWVEVGDGVFRNVADDVFIAFKDDGDGRATHIVGPFSPTAAERVPWYERAGLHAAIVALAVASFVTMGVSAIRQRRASPAGAAALRWARPVLVLAGALLSAFVLGFILRLADPWPLFYFRLPPSIYVLLTLPLLAIVPVAAAAGYTVLAWKHRAWPLGARWHYTLATLSTVAMLWTLHCWNLLGYRFG